MSLEHIRQLRRAGQKPAVVFVVIGEPSPVVDDDYGVVIVRASDSPNTMDWRPMVGIKVALFTLDPLPHLTIAVLDALQAAGAKLLGAADQAGFYPLLTENDDLIERQLRRAWRFLCPS